MTKKTPNKVVTLTSGHPVEIPMYFIWNWSANKNFTSGINNKSFFYINFFTWYVVKEFKILFLQQRSKFPDFSGFWEFPKVQKPIPNLISKSQELGKFPESINTDYVGVVAFGRWRTGFGLGAVYWIGVDKNNIF